MTLKLKTCLFTGLTLTVFTSSAFLFHYYMSLSGTLVSATNNLAEIKHIAHNLEINALARRADIARLDRMTSSLPALFDQLNNQLYQGHYATQLTDLGISFIRLKRVIDRSLPGRTIEQPLLEQIDNETLKIERSVDTLRQYSQNRISTRMKRAGLLLDFIFLALIISAVGAFWGVLRLVIAPVMSLGRQIEEVKEGKRANVMAAPAAHDEIGRLQTFTRKAIETLKQQHNALHTKQREMESHYQKQVALSRILQILLTTRTMKELLKGTLESILALEWLTVEQKGGIFLVEKNSPRNLVLASSINFSESIISTCKMVPYGRCLCGLAAASKTIIYASHPDHRHAISYQGMNDHGHYCVPIVFGEELLGVICLYLASGHKKHSDEERFLYDVASILAGTIVRRRLEEQQRMISTAVDQAGEGVIITDPGGKILYANPFVSTMTGYENTELIGRDSQLLYGNMADEELRRMTDTVASGNTWEGKITGRRKDGSHYPEKTTITPVRDQLGGIVNYVAIKKDITGEIELKAQLAQAQKMESVGRLAGGIAHDFNNILSAIIGFSELALHTISDSDPMRENFQIIKESGEKAALLTEQLLAFSRKQVLEMKPLDLNFLVEKTSRMVSRMIGEDIDLEINALPGEIPIKADAGQMEQILMNLAINARDAMPDGGRIVITTAKTDLPENSTTGGYAILTVTDTGLGMPPDVQDKIFEPFYTTKKLGKGTGLGLSTVYGIVKQHNGQISVRSAVGKGTTFTIRLPFFQGAPEKTEKKSPPKLLSGTETVLVVDDDVFLRRMIVETLRPLGYEVIEAASGQEALTISSGQEINLLLTDVIMPGMNGRELADRITAEQPATKVVFMSGYMDETISRHGVLKPGGAFLRKPLSPAKLASVLREVLDG